jgi:hypothetical protein
MSVGAVGDHLAVRVRQILGARPSTHVERNNPARLARERPGEDVVNDQTALRGHRSRPLY